MTPEERAEKIALYGRGYDLLKTVLEDLPHEMWQYKPAPDEWSIHEILIHLADSESNSFARFRAPIAQPGITLFVYDQDVWAKTMAYHNQSWKDALELLRLLRRMTYNLIKNLPEAVWSNEVVHPEMGTITLDDVLDLYAAHVPGHIEQIKNNYAAWQKEQEQGK